MTHRDRVLAVFEGEQPDRIPKDLGSTIWTTMDASSYNNLKQYLKIYEKTEYKSLGFNAVEIDERILRYFGIDTRGLTINGPKGWKDVISDEGIYIDEWGIKRNVKMGCIISHPLNVSTYAYKELEKFNWPDGTDPSRFDGFSSRLQYWKTNDFATVLNVFGGFTTMSYLLRGFDNWCMDMMLDEELFQELLDRTLKFEIDSARTALSNLGSFVDIVAIADDFAGQEGLFFSPSHFRRFIKPRMEKLISVIRENCKCKILFHSCGAVREIIPDFIELGIDALNPFQTSAFGMDPTELKSAFGGKIVFWGGVDTQNLLPNGTIQQISVEVKKLIEIMSSECGYVLAAVHNIQGDVPPENIVCLFKR